MNTARRADRVVGSPSDFAAPLWRWRNHVRVRRIATIVAVTLVAACTEDTAPVPSPDTGPPGIRLLVGAGQEDTVDAVLPQAVVVEVRDSAGRLAPGAALRFQSLPDGRALSVAPLTGQFAPSVVATSDAEGQAGVIVRLGSQVGPARLRVSSWLHGWADTATFTVLAGAPVRVLAEPTDTTIRVGASFQLRAWVTDRYGHPRLDAVTLESLDSAATVGAGGVVTGRAAGVARIVARAGGLTSDTSRVKLAGTWFLGGDGQVDTVDAVLPQALIVQVFDTHGRLSSGQVVRFDVRPDANALSIATLNGPFGPSVIATTNVDGQVGVRVRFGTRPGDAQVLVRDPYGWVDTAAFTVRAGAPARVFAEPSDTTITLNSYFPLRAWAIDRHANLAAESVTYESLDAQASVGPNGFVWGRAPGVARVLARVGGLSSDTTRVTVELPPAGTIAASTAAGVMVVDLDGSGSRLLPIATAGANGRSPSWLADTAIAVMDGQSYGELLRVSLSGAVQYLVPAKDVVVLEVWPQASRDGAWIYFTGLVPGYSTRGLSVWRVHPDGSGLERISPPNVDGQGETYASPSPDGTRVAVSTSRLGGWRLAVIDVASAGLTVFGPTASSPRWAPVGDTIAYVAGTGGGQIWLVHASGTGARRVSPLGRIYDPGIDWSPDGRWIIARGPAGLELIEVATGRVVALPDLPRGLSQPSWKW